MLPVLGYVKSRKTKHSGLGTIVVLRTLSTVQHRDEKLRRILTQSTRDGFFKIEGEEEKHALRWTDFTRGKKFSEAE